MNRSFLFSFLLVIFLFTDNVYSWDSTAARYFPLSVGNSWTYNGQGTFPGPCWTREKYTVTGTTVLNGHIYFTVRYTGIYSPYDYYLRIDSTSMNVMRYTTTGGCAWTPSEKLLDSLRSRLQDSFKVDCTNWWKSVDTTWQSVIGVNRASKHTYWFDGFELSMSRYLSKDFGLTKWVNCAGAAGCCTKTLIGCVINGILYGDTTLTAITPLSSEIPENFSLSQNYPNPFNPVTNIEFSIPKSTFVAVIIYDISGQEIEILVSQNLTEGKYSVDWNASKYPSGIYYYKVEAGDYSETKKMVLVK